MHVDFFIAGVQKGGTTAIDAMLRRHPGIEMAARKEPHFFDNELIDWHAPDYEVLHRLYNPAADPHLRGEATPVYTYWPNALERLAAYNLGAKLVIVLRHPVWRAFSHWKMEVSRNADAFAFAAAIREGRTRVRQVPGGVHRVFSYVERGFYAAQIERAFRLFSRQNVHIFRTDELWRSPHVILERLQTFLGVPVLELAAHEEYIVPLASRADLALTDEDYQYLLQLYSSDIETVARLTGIDLSD